MGVEQRRLAGDGFDDMRMAVSDMRHIVVAVEIFTRPVSS